jgi:DNA (cytosine-5)-methyltransferase 1
MKHFTKSGKAGQARKEIAIDLFSGCGGLTLGLKQAGFHVVAAVERDPLAAETYKANHQEVRVWLQDIRKLPATKVMHELHLECGELDLLAGCPPCQGFSTMTTLNGKKPMRHPLNELVFDFLRFARTLRPKAIMFENVPGIVHSKQFKKLLLSLDHLGYQYEYAVLDAAKYGVPQRRRRLILVGSRVGHVHLAQETRIRRTVRDVLQRLANRLRNDPLHTLGERHSPRIAAIIRSIPKNGGSRMDLGQRSQLKCHRTCDGFKDVYGRMAWDDVAPTITSGCFNPSKGRFLHPTENRAISLREAALLQSFPPDYFFSLARGKSYVAQMIGNALPPEFIRRHALQVKKSLKVAQHGRKRNSG